MIISILVNRFLIRKIFALWEEKKKKTLTFDNANRVAILIRPPVLLGVANTAPDPDAFYLARCKLMLCQAIGAGRCATTWVSRIERY